MADDAIGFFKVNDIPGGMVVLTDPDGRTLYTFDQDPPGATTCTGACAHTWPPMVAVERDQPFHDFTIVTRADGTRQWAYKGKPLYRNVGDAQPGQAAGNLPEQGWRVIEIRAHQM